MNNPMNSGGFLTDTIQDGIAQANGGGKLQYEHPELYGRLLMANEQLENVGTMVIWLMLVFVLGLCVTIHMAWIDPVFGVPIERLQGWGVYSLIAIVSFVLYCIYNEIFGKIAYRRIRPGIASYLGQQGLTIPWLVAQLENDDSMESVAAQLKNDSLTTI